VSFDLYVWSNPRELAVDQAKRLIDGWLEAGGDPVASPFEATSDIGWFYRELKEDVPAIDAVTDAVPTGKVPVWMSSTQEPAARIVAIRLSRPPVGEEVESIFGLATKYDLVVYDPHAPRLHLPLAEMAAFASATFWPRGAIQAAVAGAAGAVIAAVAWVIGIPIASGIAIIVGLFLAVMAVLTFIAEGRKAIAARGSQPP
jgi:hypothetical protein